MTYLVKLGPGHHHVAKVIHVVRFVENLLGQEVQVVVVQVLVCLDLRGEFAVESVAHHPPGHSLWDYEWYSVLITTTGETPND